MPTLTTTDLGLYFQGATLINAYKFMLAGTCYGYADYRDNTPTYIWFNLTTGAHYVGSYSTTSRGMYTMLLDSVNSRLYTIMNRDDPSGLVSYIDLTNGHVTEIGALYTSGTGIADKEAICTQANDVNKTIYLGGYPTGNLYSIVPGASPNVLTNLGRIGTKGSTYRGILTLESLGTWIYGTVNDYAYYGQGQGNFYPFAYNTALGDATQAVDDYVSVTGDALTGAAVYKYDDGNCYLFFTPSHNGYGCAVFSGATLTPCAAPSANRLPNSQWFYENPNATPNYTWTSTGLQPSDQAGDISLPYSISGVPQTPITDTVPLGTQAASQMVTDGQDWIGVGSYAAWIKGSNSIPNQRTFLGTPGNSVKTIIWSDYYKRYFANAYVQAIDIYDPTLPWDDTPITGNPLFKTLIGSYQENGAIVAGIPPWFFVYSNGDRGGNIARIVAYNYTTPADSIYLDATYDNTSFTDLLSFGPSSDFLWAPMNRSGYDAVIKVYIKSSNTWGTDLVPFSTTNFGKLCALPDGSLIGGVVGTSGAGYTDSHIYKVSSTGALLWGPIYFAGVPFAYTKTGGNYSTCSFQLGPDGWPWLVIHTRTDANQGWTDINNSLCRINPANGAIEVMIQQLGSNIGLATRFVWYGNNCLTYQDPGSGSSGVLKVFYDDLIFKVNGSHVGHINGGYAGKVNGVVQ